MLTTHRLILRPMGSQDAEDVFDLESDPEMVHFQDFDVRTLASAQSYCDAAQLAWNESSQTYFEFSVLLRSDLSKVIGRVGAFAEDDFMWIWYVIAKPLWNQGFAKEAASSLLEYLTSIGFKKVRIECDPANLGSVRLAQSLGFALMSESATSKVFAKE